MTRRSMRAACAIVSLSPHVVHTQGNGPAVSVERTPVAFTATPFQD